MKARLSSLDIRALANELDVRLTNKYIQNFYSTQQRFMYLKLSNRDVLLLEPGVCAHISRTHDMEISHFCKKLREKCRHARVRRIYQHSFDRVLVIDISRCKIVVEFFSSGNIYILDAEDNIVDLLRPVPELGIVKGSKYIWNTVLLDLTHSSFCARGLSDILPFEKEYVEFVKNDMESKLGPLDQLKEHSRKQAVELYFDELKQGLDKLGGFCEAIVKNGGVEQFHVFPTFGKNQVCDIKHPEKKKCIEPEQMPADSNKSRDEPECDLAALSIEQREYSITDEKTIEHINRIGDLDKEAILEIIRKDKKLKVLHFPTVNEAIEIAFADKKKAPKQKKNKAERIAHAQEQYIKELALQAESYEAMAIALEDNRQFVNDILKIFNRVFENKMKWEIFDLYWAEEKSRGQRHSMAIASYDLKKKRAILDIDSMMIEVDLGQPLNQTIRDLFNKKKKALDKAEKTKQAMQNIIGKLCPKQISVKPQRRVPYWFERYHWCIASDGTLIIGGKNAQDNEAIVKTHMDKTDLYFHCDVHGASSVICKGRSETAITEAAYVALVFSKSWEEGIMRRVFYVEPGQVSKTAPSGEFLSKGGFAIVGKKTFVDPYRLEYGFGILFREEGAQALEFSSRPTRPIVHALPVCAPWSVVKEYKYRSRLCPGNEKKSVIAHAIQKTFYDLSVGSLEELAVKAIGIDEFINALPTKSKQAKIVK